MDNLIVLLVMECKLRIFRFGFNLHVGPPPILKYAIANKSGFEPALDVLQNESKKFMNFLRP